nr:hypothetical protein [Candidatus Sigynarchaeota archaeon]
MPRRAVHVHRHDLDGRPVGIGTRQLVGDAQHPRQRRPVHGPVLHQGPARPRAQVERRGPPVHGELADHHVGLEQPATPSRQGDAPLHVQYHPLVVPAALDADAMRPRRAEHDLPGRPAFRPQAKGVLAPGHGHGEVDGRDRCRGPGARLGDHELGPRRPAGQSHRERVPAPQQAPRHREPVHRGRCQRRLQHARPGPGVVFKKHQPLFVRFTTAMTIKAPVPHKTRPNPHQAVRPYKNPMGFALDERISSVASGENTMRAIRPVFQNIARKISPAKKRSIGARNFLALLSTVTMEWYLK